MNAIMEWLIIIATALGGFLLWRGNAFASNPPRSGEAAPAFSLSDQNGRIRCLADFGATWLVLYFFPRADTPG